MSIRPTRRVSSSLLALALGMSAAAAQPAKKPAPTALILACRIQGGGFAITDPTGQILESGDGVPFAPPPRATLRITTTPASVQVTDGSLPHPGCATGPVLQSPISTPKASVPKAPVEVTWCDATYQITRTEGRAYAIRSKASTIIAGGEQAGDTMQSFMVGTCTSREPAPDDQLQRLASSPSHQSPDRRHPVAPRKRPR